MALRIILAVILCLAAQIMLLLPHPAAPTFSYDGPLAERLAYYTQTAYANTDKTILARTCDTCPILSGSFYTEAVVSNASTGGRAIVGYDYILHAIVVAFSGNVNCENWMLSAKIGRVPLALITSSSSAGSVHKALLAIYTSLRGSLLRNIAKMLDDWPEMPWRNPWGFPNAPFRIAGHSTGGTLAILLSLDLRLRYPNKDLVMYNFGSPRLGDSAFRDYFNKHVPKAMRVVHNYDPVRALPLYTMGYRHVGVQHIDVSGLDSHCIYVHVKISTACDILTGGSRHPLDDYLSLSVLPHQTGASASLYSYDKPLANRLAYYTQTTYANTDKTILAWSCDTCKKHLAAFEPKVVVSNNRTGGRAIAGYDSNLHAIVVAFSGELNCENWLLSAKIGRVHPALCTSSSSAGSVHEGFLEMYTSLCRSLLHNIAQLVAVHPNVPFRIAGHSRGGTLAILLSLDLKLRYPNKDLIMYNFGSPRLGDSAFRDFFNKHVPKAMRVVHTFDPVWKLPLYTMGFRHVGVKYKEGFDTAEHCIYVRVKISTGCDFLTGFLTGGRHDPDAQRP